MQITEEHIGQRVRIGTSSGELVGGGLITQVGGIRVVIAQEHVFTYKGESETYFTKDVYRTDGDWIFDLDSE